MKLRPGLVFITRKAKVVGGLNRIVRYNPAVRHLVRDAIEECRGASFIRRREITGRLTSTIIKRAQRTRYGRQFGEELAAWPVLSKSQVRDDPLAFLAPGFLRVPASTSGTTGTPLSLNRSLRSIAAEQVFLDDLLAPHGLQWGSARLAIMRGDATKDLNDRKPPFGKQTHGGHHLVLSSPHLTAASLGWFVDELDAFKPDLLYSAPTILADFLMLLTQSKHRLHIPLVVASSERLDVGLFDALQRELGATVIDYYGLSERSAFAVRQGRDQWLFQPAYGKVELMASAADEVTGCRRQVSIIATGYWNDAQPLIRYDTGDRAIVPAHSDASDLEAIAMGEKPFFGIAGRDNEFVFTPDGRRIAALNLLAREQHNALRIQVVQDALDRITVRALATPQFCNADRARLLTNTRALVPNTMAVDIEVVDRLESTESGKSPFVIRRIEPSPGR